MSIQTTKHGREYLTNLGDVSQVGKKNQPKGFRTHWAITGVLLSIFGLAFKDQDAGWVNKKSLIHYLERNSNEFSGNDRISVQGLTDQATVDTVTKIFIIAKGLSNPLNPVLNENNTPDDKDLTKSAKYEINETFIEIQVSRENVEEIPQWHLQQLCKHLPLLLNSISRVTFLGEKGGDGGGLSREYFNLLMQSLTKDTLLFKDIEANEVNFGKFPLLSTQNMTDEEVFENLGMLMMACYQTQLDRYFLGRFFNNTLFQAVFSLTEDEIDTSFQDLNPEVQVKLAKKLLGGLGAFDEFVKAIDFVLWKDGEPMPDDLELSRMVWLVDLPDDFIKDDQPDLNKIKANFPAFIQVFSKNMMNEKSLSLPASLISLTAPLHSIAKGMKSFLNDSDPQWDHLGITAVQFSNKIQGTQDRKDIVSRIKGPNREYVNYSTTEIEKKIDWLKDWLLGTTIDGIEGASDDEFSQFIKLVSGSSSLPPGENIKILRQLQPSPLPIIHTCSYQVDLSITPSSPGVLNDHTRGAFIEAMKYAMANTEGFDLY